MKKRQLLFATYEDERFDWGFSYALDLSRTLGHGLVVLMVNQKKISERFDDLMEAVTFAEHDLKKETLPFVLRSDDKSRRLKEKGRMSGVDVEVYESGEALSSAINSFIKSNSTIEMVLLGPTVTSSSGVTSKQIKKLVSSVSRPVVTMAGQSMSGA